MVAKRGQTRIVVDACSTAALEVVDRLPALGESRRRLHAVASNRGDVSELMAAVEADPALAAAVLRAANQGPTEGSVTSVRAAVRILGPDSVTKVADACPTLDFLGTANPWTSETEHFRVHALAVQRLAAAVADRAARPDADAIVTAAALHDFGKLALAATFMSYHEQVDAQATPEERVRRESELFGLDHAKLGGVLARRWRLPSVLRESIERHHDPRCEGIAAVVSVADMLAHYAAGNPIDVRRLARVSDRAGLDRRSLGAILYELPYPIAPRHDPNEGCPLSKRELEIVGALREGKVAKQIALELDLSESTIRSHLHRIYARLGVSDRAQAVLTASDRGWL